MYQKLRIEGAPWWASYRPQEQTFYRHIPLLMSSISNHYCAILSNTVQHPWIKPLWVWSCQENKLEERGVIDLEKSGRARDFPWRFSACCVTLDFKRQSSLPRFKGTLCGPPKLLQSFPCFSLKRLWAEFEGFIVRKEKLLIWQFIEKCVPPP